MKRASAFVALLLLWCAGDARSAPTKASSAFPQTVRVRLWYLHPPRELGLRAEPGQAQARKCASCKPMAVTTLTVRAAQSSIQIDREKSVTAELHITGNYQMNAVGDLMQYDGQSESERQHDHRASYHTHQHGINR